jgi:hypothetical protein
MKHPGRPIHRSLIAMDGMHTARTSPAATSSPYCPELTPATPFSASHFLKFGSCASCS